MILSCRLASRRTLDLSGPLVRAGIRLKRDFSSKSSAESGASSQPGFLTAERMKELQSLPTKSLPEVLRKYLPNLSTTLDLDDSYKPDLTSITSVAEARVVLPLYTNQEEPNVLRMLKNATRPRSKSLLEVSFGGLARSILEEMRTIREEMDVKAMEALEDAAANNDEFASQEEDYKVPELQDSVMMLQDGTLEGSTETGALREHLRASLDPAIAIHSLSSSDLSPYKGLDLRLVNPPRRQTRWPYDVYAIPHGPIALDSDEIIAFFVPLNQGNNQQQPQQQSQNPFGAAPTGGSLFGNPSGGQPAFGAPATQNPPPAFGTGAFGAPSTLAPPGGGGGLFGSALAPTSAFGSAASNTGTTTGAFGAPTSTTGGFGSSTFGSGGAFGAPRPAASSTTFGNTGFGSSFGAPSGTSNFGNVQPATATAFGASSQPTTGAFGVASQPSTGAFGASSQPASGAFGAQPGATNAFGASFSQPSTGAFGTTQPSATGTFGSTQPTTTSTFGAPPTQPNSLFGPQSAPTTNAPTSLFGQSAGNAPNTGVFGATAPSQGTALFGAQSAQPSQPAFGGASFGSTQTSTPGFGATFSTTQPTTTPFGASSLGTQSTVSPNFGAPAPSFTSASQPTNTFTFGGSAAQATASNVGGSSLQQSSMAPNFGATQPTPSAPQQSTTPTLTFGATSAPAKPATSATSGFTLPLTSTQQPTSTGGFSFGTSSSTAAAPPAPTATTNSATNTAVAAPAASSTADSKQASGSGLSSNAPTGTEAQKTESKPAFSFGTSGTTTSSTAPSASAVPSSFTTANTDQAKPAEGAAKPSEIAPLPLSTPAVKPITNLPSSVTFPSNLKNKNLEEIITSWSEELETLVNSFEKQAVEIAQWDKKIVHNGEHIIALNERVNKLETFQKEIDQSLSYVVAQQAELEGLLDGIEKELPGLTHAVTGGKQSAVDAERDRMYDTAEGVQRHVIDVANQLSKMIYEINTASAEAPSTPPAPTPQDSTGQPLAEIAQILNSHLDALQWIDRKVDELRLAAVSVKGQASKASSDMERLSSTSSN